MTLKVVWYLYSKIFYESVKFHYWVTVNSRKGEVEYYLNKQLQVQVRILLICNDKQSSSFPKAVLFCTAVWVTIHVTVIFVK